MYSNQNLLTRTEASAFIGVSEATLRRLVKSGQIKGIKIGKNNGKIFFNKQDLEKFMGTQPSNNEKKSETTNIQNLNNFIQKNALTPRSEKEYSSHTERFNRELKQLSDFILCVRTWIESNIVSEMEKIEKELKDAIKVFYYQEFEIAFACSICNSLIEKFTRLVGGFDSKYLRHQHSLQINPRILKPKENERLQLRQGNWSETGDPVVNIGWNGDDPNDFDDKHRFRIFKDRWSSIPTFREWRNRYPNASMIFRSYAFEIRIVKSELSEEPISVADEKQKALNLKKNASKLVQAVKESIS